MSKGNTFSGEVACRSCIFVGQANSAPHSWGVPKPVLGRGLGHLMNRSKPDSPPGQPALPIQMEAEKTVGPGLGTLLQGRKAADAEADGVPAEGGRRLESTPPAPAGLKWTLLLGDVLLVLVAFWIIQGARHSLEAWDVVLASSALALAAALGCWAFVLWRR